MENVNPYIEPFVNNPIQFPDEHGTVLCNTGHIYEVYPRLDLVVQMVMLCYNRRLNMRLYVGMLENGIINMSLF